MNEPQNNSKQKWIALSVITLFALSGGVYKIAKRRGSAQNPNGSQTGAQNSASNGATSQLGKGTAALGSASSTSGSGMTSGADQKEADEVSHNGGTQLGTGAPGAPLPGVGIPGAGTTAQLAPAPGALPPAEPQDQCVTITYHHKAIASHNDEEACSHHKNMLKLAKIGDARIAPQTVCVRVNGTPVHYLTVKGHADELIFGSIAGPKSKVTVHYCTGKALGCAKEDCTVPKDEFMEAIGGGESGSGDAKLGQWDPTAPAEKEADVMAKLDGEVKKELETNDDLNGRAPAGELFKDWIGETQAAACGAAQAKN